MQHAQSCEKCKKHQIANLTAWKIAEISYNTISRNLLFQFKCVRNDKEHFLPLNAQLATIWT